MTDRLDAISRRLKVEYAANGEEALRAMSRPELDLLLADKHGELFQATLRHLNGEGVEVQANVAAKLERECREITQALDGPEPFEPEMG